jgi:hypothetical protein
MTITINGSGTVTGASTLATTVASPTFTTPNIDSAQFATVSGTAPLYAARAWVNFNGTGTVAIRASGNVSSISDNATGDYTVNFTTAMSDADYSASIANGNLDGSGGYNRSNNLAAQTSSSLRVGTLNASASAYLDSAVVQVTIFR